MRRRSRAASSPRSARPRKSGRSSRSASRWPCRLQRAEDCAREFGTTSDRGSDEWKKWRKSDRWAKWNAAIAPSVAARRRVLMLIGDKQAVGVLFKEIAPRFVDRPGGYTRIVRLAKPRLGDAGTRAMLELVGVRDRVVERSVRPSFEGEKSRRRRPRRKVRALAGGLVPPS